MLEDLVGHLLQALLAKIGVEAVHTRKPVGIAISFPAAILPPWLARSQHYALL